MVISDAPAFLMVHIPKTAGTSLTTALQPEGSRRHPLCLTKTKHETLESFAARIGADTLCRYHSFSVVRHPLSRFVSHYTYLKSHPDKFPELVGLSIDDYAREVQNGNQTVIRKPERVLEQHKYLCLPGKPIAVNQVLRYENLQDDFRNLCRHLGLSEKTLPTLNASIAKASASPSVKQFCESYYQADYELFGY